MKYAFFNSGSYYLFKPLKIIHDIRDKSASVTALEFHKRMARDANRPDVFILDDSGSVIDHNI